MKFCARCGQQNDDGAVFCSRCGNSMNTPIQPASAPASSTVVVVGGNTQQAVGSNPGTIWLILNIILVVGSCCSNVMGIIGIIFAAIAMSDFGKGMYAEARSHANVAKWMFWISLILGVVGGIVAAALGLIPVILSLIANMMGSVY